MGIGKKKKGWYLEIKNEEEEKNISPQNPDNYSKSIEVASRFMKDCEKITSIALRVLIKEGMFHKLSDPKKIIVHLNFYQKGLITGRYVMTFNDVPNELVGYFKGWKYYTVDEYGNAKLYKYSYSKKKVFAMPISILILLICLFCSRFLSYDFVSGETFQTVSAFIAFFLMLVYSVMLLLSKDLAKNHFVKNEFKKLVISTIIFELPYWVATFITISKISVINGDFKSVIFYNLIIISYSYLIFKFVISIVLENDKMKV